MTSLEHVANVCSTYGLPYCPDKYEGNAQRFFTYCITDMMPYLAADNKAQYYITTVRLDYVQPLKEPYAEIMKDIKNKLLEEGFTSPEIHISATEKFRVLRYEADIIEEAF